MHACMLRYIKAWLNLFLTTMCVIFGMLYLCTWKCARVLVCTQAKVNQCKFIWLHGRPRPLTRDAVQSLTICCGYYSNNSGHVREHFGTWTWRLSTMSVTLFYFGKFETQLCLFRTDKKGLLGGVVQAFFACLKEYSSLVHCGSTPCKTHIVQENVVNCKILCLHNMQEYNQGRRSRFGRSGGRRTNIRPTNPRKNAVWASAGCSIVPLKLGWQLSSTRVLLGLEESTLYRRKSPSKRKFWETTLTIDRARICVPLQRRRL